MGPGQHSIALSYDFNIHGVTETNSDNAPMLTKGVEVLVSVSY